MTAVPKPAYELDANVILRFLRNDDPTQSPRSRHLIERAARNEVILRLSAVTVAEVFYALKTSYGVNRRAAAQALRQLLETSVFEVHELERLLDALARVQSLNVDFGDAYLAATAAKLGSEIASYDHDLDKFKDVVRFEP